ncbi:MAG: copper amine oxidase N-terminal domain-containing protein [Deltaproteobacteria bacterium]
MILNTIRYRQYHRSIPWMTLLIVCLLFSGCFMTTPVQAAATYKIPAGIDPALQAQLESAIQSNMDPILQKVETDMSSAMDPLIPQMAAMVSKTTSEKMAPQINQLAIDVIQPSIKTHVEEQAQAIGAEVTAIVGSAMAGWDGMSDPTPLIKTAITNALPGLKQKALERADQEQQKDYETIKPQVETIVQTELNALLPEIQKLVAAQLKETVPPTQQQVEADIETLINDLKAPLPDDQKKLIDTMRPQFEGAVRTTIQEVIFDEVSVNIDAKVVAGMETSTKSAIKAIVEPMNKTCTDYATTYAKSILPPQVDQLGIRSQIESMIDEVAAEHVTVFQERINSANDAMYQKQAAVINDQMHNFVKTQVLAILNGTTAPTPVTTPTTPTAPVITTSAPATSAQVFVNGQQLNFNVAPVVVQGRTLVPLRAIFESLGAQVSWDNATRTVTATKNGVVIELPVGQTQATRNGQPVTLDVPATIVQGSTMVPARFVSESLGATVKWDSNTRSVIIDSK